MCSLIILQCYIGLPVNSYPMSAKTNSSWGSKGYSTLKLVLKSAVKVSGGMTDRGQHATVSTNLILFLYLNTSSSYTQVTEKKENMFSWKYSNISHAQLARLQWNLANSNTLERKGNIYFFYFTCATSLSLCPCEQLADYTTIGMRYLRVYDDTTVFLNTAGEGHYELTQGCYQGKKVIYS